MKYFLFLVLCLNCTIGNSQTLESRQSNSNSYFNNSTLFRSELEGLKDADKVSNSILPISLIANTKDKQIDVRNSYSIDFKNQRDLALIFGGAIGGKMESAYETIFKGNNLVGGYKSGAILGLKWRTKDSSKDKILKENFKKYHLETDEKIKNELEKNLIAYAQDNIRNAEYWIYIGPEWYGRKFHSISELNSIDIQKQHFTKRNIAIGFATFQNDIKLGFLGFFDLSLIFNKDDNFSSLTEIKSQKAFQGIKDGNTISNQESFTAYYGNYTKDVKSKSLSFETYLVSKNLPAFGLYFNPLCNFNNSLYKNAMDFNYTIYFLTPGESLLSPKIGLAFSHADISKKRDEIYKEKNSRFSLGIVTKLSIHDWFN